MLLKNKKKFISFSLAAGALFLLAAAVFYFHAFRDEGRLDEGRRAQKGKERRAIGKRLQSLLQEKAKQVLSEHIALKRPDIQRVDFHRVQAKAVSSNKVKMFFSYTLSTDKPETAGAFSAEAEAWLTRDKSDGRQWTLSGFQVKESLMDFAEPFLVKASSPSFAGAASDSSLKTPGEARPDSGEKGGADDGKKPAVK